MRPLRAFDEYLSERIIKKVTPDHQRAESLKIEAGRKFASLQRNVEKLGIDDENANDFVEYCYNIIMFLIRSRMYEEGYAGSGKGAHEGEVSFTQTLGFPDAEIRFLNQLRHFRNRILYYGKQFDTEYATKVLEFTETVYERLK